MTSRTRTRGLARAVVLAVALAAASDASSAAVSPQADNGQRVQRVHPAVRDALLDADWARVLVSLRDAVPGTATAEERVAAVADVQAGVLAALPLADVSVVHQYSHVAALCLQLRAAALDALERHPLVDYVQLDERVSVDLTQAVPALGANTVHTSLGFRGTGVTVAILDTGIDVANSDFSGRIAAQRCFTDASCPPDNTSEGTSAQDQHGHGTHVAGIVGSSGAGSPVGFAPAANLVAVRVLDATGSGYLSDTVSGLNWILANLSTRPVDVVNMSLGSDTLYAGACDAAQPAMASAISQLVNSGVTVFAASGNDASAAALGAPACVTGAISVGATYDASFGSVNWGVCIDPTSAAGQIACFTNSNATLDIVAPGAVITASRLGGGSTNKSGTSMASPVAAGVAALMLQADGTLTPAEVEAILEGTASATPSDPKNGLQFPLINALNAVNQAVQGAPVSITALTTSPACPVTVGSQVTWTAAATGGAPPLQYKFWLYDQVTSTWTLLRDYGTSSQVAWTPASTGSYYVQAWARSAGSTAPWEAWLNGASCAVASAAAPVITSVMPAPPSPGTVGAPVTWTATASGGGAPLQYKFWLYHQNSVTWTLLQDYSTSSQAVWTPSAAGSYWLQVWVRSAGSGASYEAWRNSDAFTVSAPSSVVISGVVPSPASPRAVGTPITWTATASGGTAPLQFRFWIYSQNTATWMLLQDYSTSNQAVWTPSATGAYHVQVWVRSAGSAASYEAWRNSGTFIAQ